MPTALVGLGSNQGDRRAALDQAVIALRQAPQVHVAAVSSWHETAPVGGPASQPPFLNGAIRLETSLSPPALLDRLQRIENAGGRVRHERWGPRTLDLDLLLYDEQILHTPSLTLPHPRMAWRRFVLEPAAEVASAMQHPAIGWTIGELLEHLNTAPPYVAIAGPIGVGKTHLAERLVAAVSGQFIEERPDWPKLDAFYADPSGQAWAIELGFLGQRATLLAANASDWRNSRWKVSDFWFDQSAAFARAWLPAEQWPDFSSQFEQMHREVVRPKLLVLLDLPAEDLLARVHRRGRSCERRLTVEQLARVRREVREQVERSKPGPVLFLDNREEASAFSEVLAAIRGME